MAARASSPRSQQRYRLLDAYRGRGRRNNNLFLVYSVKTQRDFILPSDRQFIHWIHFLETAPDVKTFEIAPKAAISHDSKELRATELDAYVRYWDGREEWHEVKSDEKSIQDANPQLLAQSSLSSKLGTSYIVISDEELKPHVESSLRWLKVITYASTLRDFPLIFQTTKLLDYCALHRQGTLGELIKALEAEIPDTEIIKGLVARLAIIGSLSLDLSQFGFSAAAGWLWCPHE
jgi:hypothetical protein